MPRKSAHLRVSILAIPDTFMSCLSGIVDVLGLANDRVKGPVPFDLEIVALEPRLEIGFSRMPLKPHRTLDAVRKTDIVIVPTTAVEGEDWIVGRYPKEVNWLRSMHDRGAMLCSACSGALLLAETGLLNGREVTSHWIFRQTFLDHFPEVRLRMERELVVSEDGRFVMSGASSAWHDLVLYLIARFSGPVTARSVAKFFMLQSHEGGQTPYIPFDESPRHTDRAILEAQNWLRTHWPDANPVETMIAASGLSRRNFARRFRQATGYAPLAFVQGIRIERAKQMLENTNDPVERISLAVGYEDASFFRRLFKRTVGLRPIDYRRRFALPQGSRFPAGCPYPALRNVP